MVRNDFCVAVCPTIGTVTPYRFRHHLALPQSSSVSRFTVGASGRSVPNCMWWFENGQCNNSDAVGRLSLW
jgi:hypothetical protein